MTTMTEAAEHPPQPVSPQRSGGEASTAARLTFARVVRSEWIKLRTLRSTWTTLAAVLGVLIGFGLIAATVAGGAASGSPGGPTAGSDDPVSTVLTGANLAVLVVGVLGAVIGAREFASGLIRTTLAAVPSRLPVLWAKAIALCTLLVPVTVGGVLVAFVAGMGVLGARGQATLAWSDPGVARALLGTAAYLVGIGLVGLALGMLIRGTAGAIGLLLGGVLILPSLATALLPDSWDAVLKLLPSNAAEAFTSRLPSPDLLGSGAGMAVFALWVVLALAGAAAALKGRDA
jgi:ABC-type transport system involved in multi-copper enzyme maturation permease subunit